MKLLFFSPRPFWPLDTGAKLRDYHLARQLALRAQVSYLSFAENHSAPAGSFGDDLFERVVTVARPASYTPVKLMRGLFGPVPVTVLNYTTAAMKHALESLLAEGSFDAVQMESVHLCEYLPVIRRAARPPKIIVDWHNVESELMQRYGDRVRNFARRLYAQATARKLEQCERNLPPQCDLVCVASERERQVVLGWAPDAQVEVIENGVDAAYYRDEALLEASATFRPPGGWAASHRAIVYVGSMDYHANIEAVLRFGSEVWPAIHADSPDLVFQVVGRNPPAEVRALGSMPQTVVTGSVPDVRPYYHHALAAVVPLRVGSGTRLKILEAMAAGTPVVSTALGAEGLNVTPGRDFLLAETAKEFRAAIAELRNNPARRAELVHNGRQLVRARYDWHAIGSALYACHQRLVPEAARADVGVGSPSGRAVWGAH